MNKKVTLLFTFWLISSLCITPMAFAQNWGMLDNVESGGMAQHNGTLYVLDNDKIQISTDVGKTWTVKSTPAIGDYSEVAANDNEILLINRGFGFNPVPTVYKSTDGGNNWNIDTVGLTNQVGPMPKYLEYLGGNWYLFSGTIWNFPAMKYENNKWNVLPIKKVQAMCEANGELFAIKEYGLVKSTDGGATWTDVAIPGFRADDLYAHDGKVYVLYNLNDTRELYISSDNGATWTTKDLNPYTVQGNINRNQIQNIVVNDDIIAMALNDNDNKRAMHHFITSTDGGATFKLDSAEGPSGGMHGLHDVEAIGTSVFATYEDGVYSNTTSGGGGNDNVETLKVVNTNVYPNPATGVLFIEAKNNNTISSYQLVNINGKLVLNSANINSNKVEINASNLTAGIYLIQVTSGNSTELHKVVIK